MSVFQDIPAEEITHDGRTMFAIRDRFPVSNGHTLIISRRLVPTFFDLSIEERAELLKMIDDVKADLDKVFNPDGYNIGMNCGEVAGQTVMHFHCHLIPRYRGDMSDPRGGVRHCVEGRGSY